MMTQPTLRFQYQSLKETTHLTGFSGLPLYLELIKKANLEEKIQQTLKTKEQGWSDAEVILSLILLNLAGGDCISDINTLESDRGLRALLAHLRTSGLKRKARRSYMKRWRKLRKRGLPCTAVLHRYLRKFHNFAEEEERVQGEGFIPKANNALKALQSINQQLVACAQAQRNYSEATLDQDATLIESYKRNAQYCYKKFKAYQPFNTYWAEAGLVLHSELRDGNVYPGFEQLRLLKEGLKQLPEGVEKVFLRSDSAGYQQEILAYCAEGKDERFGVIEFAIAARVTKNFKAAVKELQEKHWHPIYQDNGKGGKIETGQEWAEVGYVPVFATKRKNQPEYRYLAIREKMKPAANGKELETKELPFQTIQANGADYKLFGVVTNRTLFGEELLHWHRERCGKSEGIHHAQKEGLAGGQLPSQYFGANAAWWQIMILALNINQLMQSLALPDDLCKRKMKGLRLAFIQLPGRVVQHAREFWIQVEAQAYKRLSDIRDAIANMVPMSEVVDSS